MSSIKFDLNGRTVIAMPNKSGWKMYYAGTDGKRRPATDIIVPSDITESGLEQYLTDLCHEWATECNPGVKRLT